MEGLTVKAFEGTFFVGLWGASAKGGQGWGALEDPLLLGGCVARVGGCCPVTVGPAATEASSLLRACHRDPLSLGICAVPRRKAEAGPLPPLGLRAWPSRGTRSCLCGGGTRVCRGAKVNSKWLLEPLGFYS